mgnify:CR=1 FL=1
MNKSYIDLHMHSLYSDDGEFTPTQLVEMCHEAGVKIMAIADHNWVKAIYEAKKKAEELKIKYIPAIEIDCTYKGINLHVLGYGIDYTNPAFNQLGEDILKQVVHYFLSGGQKQKTLLIPKFSWWYYKSIADEVNGRTIFYPLFEDGNTFKYDIQSIRETVEREKPEIVLIASPNNPTGNSLSKEELHEILSFIPRETAIVIDEAYASFSNKDTSYIKPLIEEFPNLLIIRTLSKFYGLPGLRLGFAFIGKNLSSFLNYSTKYLGYNRLSEEIGIAVLKANDYYQNVADLMAEDRETYMREIGALEGFKVYHSEANFILVKYPISLKSQLQNAFKAKDLIIKFMNEEDINTHMRITLGTQKQNRLVIDTIKEVVSTPS